MFFQVLFTRQYLNYFHNLDKSVYSFFIFFFVVDSTNLSPTFSCYRGDSHTHPFVFQFLDIKFTTENLVTKLVSQGSPSNHLHRQLLIGVLQSHCSKKNPVNFRLSVTLFRVGFYRYLTLRQLIQFDLESRFIVRTQLRLSIQSGSSTSQPAFTFSNLTTETLEQGVKYVQS